MKILLIEDDPKTADFIVKGLKQEGFNLDHADEGESGLFLACSEKYDVVIVDIMLPMMDGLTLIRKMRENRIDTPVLVLSARNSVPDKVKGLQTGGDDYMVKPFAFSELVARIRTLMRRQIKSKDPIILEVGELKLDLHRRKVFIGKQEVQLQPREVLMLEFLMRNQGRVVSKTMIMEHVWDFNFDPQTNVVEAKISKLRSKLAEVSRTNFIHTVKGLGYVCEIKD